MNELKLVAEYISSPAGRVCIVTDSSGVLRALDWDDHSARMHKLLGRHCRAYTLSPIATPQRTAAADALEAYFSGDFGAIAGIKTQTYGTEFQEQVWQGLRQIPLGETRSYAALAQAIGRPTAVRAVGAANGANPISIVVPCHRVIGSNASLTGFAGGLERKRWLLEHEQAAL